MEGQIDTRQVVTRQVVTRAVTNMAAVKYARTNAEILAAFTPGNTVALHHGNDVGTQHPGDWSNGRFLRMERKGNVNGDGGWKQLMELPKSGIRSVSRN